MNHQKTTRKKVQDQIKETAENRRWIKKLKALGTSNREIAIALGISEEDLLLQS